MLEVMSTHTHELETGRERFWKGNHVLLLTCKMMTLPSFEIENILEKALRHKKLGVVSSGRDKV
jgi:hypothetical protein